MTLRFSNLAPHPQRAAYRREIADLLDTLPKSATKTEMRRRVMDRRQSRATDVFRQELKKEIECRIEKNKPRLYALPRLSIVFPATVRIDVECEYCRDARLETRGCLVCREQHESLDRLLRYETFIGLLKTCRAAFGTRDHGPFLLAADWLDEYGECDLADQFRALPSGPAWLAEL